MSFGCLGAWGVRGGWGGVELVKGLDVMQWPSKQNVFQLSFSFLKGM